MLLAFDVARRGKLIIAPNRLEAAEDAAKRKKRAMGGERGHWLRV